MAEWDIEEAMNRLFGGGERTPSNQGGWNIDEALERLFGGSAAPAEPVVTLPAEYGTVTYPAPAYDFWSVTHRNGGASLSDNPELAAVRRWPQVTMNEPRVTLPTWYGGYPRSAYGGPESYATPGNVVAPVGYLRSAYGGPESYATPGNVVAPAGYQRSAYGGPESYATPGNVVAPTDERAQALADARAQNEGLVTLPNGFATPPNEWGVSYPVGASTAPPTPPSAQPPPTPPPTTPTAPPTSSSTPISSPTPTATATPAPTPMVNWDAWLNRGGYVRPLASNVQDTYTPPGNVIAPQPKEVLYPTATPTAKAVPTATPSARPAPTAAKVAATPPAASAEKQAAQRLNWIVEDSNHDGAQALIRVFEDDRLGDAAGRTSSERLEWLFGITKGNSPEKPGGIFPTHFAVEFGSDLHLKPEFRDSQFYPDWLGTHPGAEKEIRQSNQVAHFLTAVDLAYHPLMVPVYTDPTGISNDTVWVDMGELATVGHEKVSDLWWHDQGLPKELASLTIVEQVRSVNGRDIELWRAAIVDDENGDTQARDDKLIQILTWGGTQPVSTVPGIGYFDPQRVGNSMADLRLSLKGVEFAHLMKDPAYSDPQKVAEWLRTNLTTLP